MFFNRSLITGLLCLLLYFSVQAQGLQQKVSLQLTQVSTQEALQEINSRYKVQFSYLNNDLPAGKTVQLQVKEVPLKEVMDQLLAPTQLGYAEHNGRIIISRSLPKPSPKPAKAPAVKEKPQSNAPSAPVKEAPMLPMASAAQPEVETEEEEIAFAAETRMEEAIAPPPTRLHAGLENSLFSRLKTSLQKQNEDYHFGVIYPLSTHGREAGQYVNKVSLHLLIGVAAGLQGFEASSIGNIENDYVKGVQLAGVFNVVKNDVNGIQAGGMLNYSGDSVYGAQLAGFFNVSRNHLRGAQLAGFGNLSGDVQGAQFAGFGNVTTYMHGSQFAGFANVAGIIGKGSQYAGFVNVVKQVKGVQVSGFTNIGGSVQGLQLAGFANIGNRVTGVQFASLLNVANHVEGVQLGFLNIADSIDGVPIGFLSIVRNGYRSLELGTAEDFEANLAFKIGVERFYNIFAVSSQVQDPQRWGVGYGFGTLWRLGNRLRLNADIISMQVAERGISEGWPGDMKLNLLNKFKLQAGWQFARHFSIYAGPTYNLMVSQHRAADGSIGSQLPNYTFYDKTYNGRTNIKMWAGFTAGIRF